MIATIEWITNTAGCGGIIAGTVFIAATIVYVASLRWIRRANQTEEREE
jgi:hypothetical protein